MQNVERWGVYEVELRGPADGNPFVEVQVSAEFRLGHRAIAVDGFYDGDGVYRVRFMPDMEGEWSFTTRSNRPQLDGKSGRFTCTPPTGSNHGPVRVSDACHFAYEDGTRYSCVGTTCYGWANQPEDLQDQTIRTLASAPFNKMRMCVFPKNYIYNRNDPPSYPFVRKGDGTFDLRRFNPVFWRNYERRIGQLRDMNIEADLILFHPYDEGKWGFDRMDADSDDFYLKYAIARLAAYRNVWWSLANEWDFMKHKKEADFDRFFRIIQTHDHVQHLRGIHNGTVWYDHGKPWVTHASVQNSDTAQAGKLREQYRRPVVYDECCYEGNIEWLWGNITPQLMVKRFWDGFCRGGYVGHGETYLHPQDILWWSKGGVLHGQSPVRIAFLRKIIEETPGPLTWLPDFVGWEGGAIGACGIRGQFYLVYFGNCQPAVKDLYLPAEGRFRIEAIDTWEMTITPLPGEYTGTSRINLPGKPYIALRIARC